jgi:hypothetical protein
MLERIEGFYLACLRVVVLVAATVALAVFVWACSQSLPSIAGELGFHTSGSAAPPSLADYIQEQQPTGTPTTAGLSAETVAAVPPKTAEAARLLTHYLTTRHSLVDTSHLTEVLVSDRSQVDEDRRPLYDSSLVALMQQLDLSKGAPLDTDHINGLLNWHLAKFTEAAEAEKLRKAEAAAKASASMMVGAAALVSFLLIIFFFIFVKIERNLRLVRTIEVVR